MLRPIFLPALVAVLVGLAGCGDDSTGLDVTGTVTYLDKPLANGVIYFFPATGKPTVAALDADGSYSIELPPGEYRVVVNKSDPIPPGWKEGDPPPPSTVVIPAQYSEPARTVLKATVAEDQDQPINFKLQ